ncbi:hypothetical protein NESM_000557500 [Novymonas esmeraldas]|uniref:Proteophosphoglycan ppg4 n=1 Tax=Novymonas esmeraldas TaxID=1808958 RepID=A0AAW0ET58_9TRYP
MSRRIFLENMRQEARDRGGYDSESRSHANTSPPFTEDTGVHNAHVLAGELDSAAPSPLAAPLLLTTPPPLPQLQSGDARSIATSITPHLLSPPSHVPLSSPHSPSSQRLMLHQRSQPRPEHRDVASSSSGGSSSRRRPHPRLSPDTVFKFGHDDVLPSGESSSTRAAAAAATRRRSTTGHVRRSSGSVSSTADLRGHADSGPTSSRRLSQGRTGAAQPRKSLSAASPSSAHRAASRHDRLSSINRMEASMVALQVELATEKRNNIEAEQHITTLNREVTRLRLENVQLSREVAVAATAAHNAPTAPAGSTGLVDADALATASAAPAGADAVAPAKRIEMLEARLGELLRNMETKQRELDTKDERIRLLEHKLADQLLLYSGMGYMGMVAPRGAAATVQTSSVATHALSAVAPEHRTQAAAGQHTGGNGAFHGLQSRLQRQAEAPDTATTGPRIGSIRTVTAYHPLLSQGAGGDSATARPTSAVRSRSGVHSLGRRDSADAAAEVAAAAARGQPVLTPHNGAHRQASATRDRRRPTPQRPSVRPRPAATPSRTGSIDPTTAAGRSAAGSAVKARPGAASPAATSSARRRRDSSDSVVLGAHRPPSELTRSGSTGGPRRPSVNRRLSTSSARPASVGRDEAPRVASRRSSTSSPLRRQTSASGSAAGGHPMHLGSLASGGVDHRAPSPAGSPYGRLQSAFLAHRSPSTTAPRSGSATRSVAQQSVRSGTSTRSRPQITYSADSDSATMKGTTTTVVFRTGGTNGNGLYSAYSQGSYARDGAALLPSRTAASSAEVSTTAADDVSPAVGV